MRSGICLLLELAANRSAPFLISTLSVVWTNRITYAVIQCTKWFFISCAVSSHYSGFLVVVLHLVVASVLLIRHAGFESPVGRLNM